ncbi:MAG: hypothetical protein C5B58_04290 [Acidobacteria bacterium]|nr:MAG: hypothetical protein C5B58_04290 [Acidobacteriota bacterium]
MSALEPCQTEETALAKRLVSHWQQEFGSVVISRKPFEHFYTDRAWPADVYDQILHLLPPGEVYEPLNTKEYVNANGVSTRDKCYLPEILARLEPRRRTFWYQIWLALTAESLKQLIFRKLKEDVALRLGVRIDEVEKVDVSVHISLARDIEDYCIKPHPDGHPAIVTAQFYLPVDVTQKDLGTSFYVERAPLRRFLFGHYEEVKRMQFLPNSGYFFAVNDLPGHRSLHGRERIRAGTGVRNSMLVRWSKPGSSRKHGNAGVSSTHALF